MKLTNYLKKEESKDKRKCEITFLYYLEKNLKLSTPTWNSDVWNYIDVIAKITNNIYLFETYDNIANKGTKSSIKYIGTWNGVEQ